MEHIAVAVPIARVFVGLGCTVAGTITIITYRFQELCCAVADFAFELRHIPPILRRTASGAGLGVDSSHELLCGVTRRYLRDMLRRRQASFCGSGLSDRGFTLRLTEPLFGATLPPFRRAGAAFCTPATPSGTLFRMYRNLGDQTTERQYNVVHQRLNV